MSLSDKPTRAIAGEEFLPGYIPEKFHEFPQLETRTPQMMALDIEILKGDIADLTARLLALENKENGSS